MSKDTADPSKVEAEESVTVESIDSELFDENDADPVYFAKSRLVSKAIDEIGFGRYQWGLFFIAGFGWFADNAFPVATSLILPRLIEVDGVHHPADKAPLLTLAQNLGLLAGALFWSTLADIIGRRWAFTLTFLFSGVFGVISGSAPNFAAIGIYCALWSFGVGGNLPVDSALFLEVLPTNKKWILTVMSSWWALGQVITNLISWGLIGNYSCSTETGTICYKADNQGWRYFLYTIGGLTLLMFLSRFIFGVLESPRFYLSKGNDAKAVEIIHKIAKFNRIEINLTEEQFLEIDKEYGIERSENDGTQNQLLKEKLTKYNFSHIRQCFGTKKLFISSSLVIWTWGLIGLAFPLYNAFLPYYIETRSSSSEPLSTNRTYRNTLIVAVLGIPGALIAGLLVELKIGRKGTLIISLLLTGIVLFCSTTARSQNAQLAWNCLFSFFSNIMYGVLYAYTPEVFYSKIRGTGVGLSASFNRVFGVFAPIIAMYADLTTSAPIFVSGALFLLSGVLVVFFPYEPRGKASY